MKFMKLGSKPDSFQTDGNNVRYAASDLASDIVVNVGDIKFHLHKFPLLSKCSLLQKLVASADDGSGEVHIHDIPGGPSAFEICAKFCYGMTVTLNAYNVVSARCASEFLGMEEAVEKGNLIYKIDVFLSSSIFRSWKDSIIVLQTMKPVLTLAEDLKLSSHCIDAIASRASADVSKVDWSYTYNRKKLPEENGNDPNWNGVRTRNVPKDWWVEDLSELEIDFYKRVISGIISKGNVSHEVIGEALKAYAVRKLPGFGKGGIQLSDVSRAQTILQAIVGLLPAERGTVSCGFLLKLLKASILVGLGESAKRQLVSRIGQQLEEASVSDLLVPSQDKDTTIYDVQVVREILQEFLMRDKNDASGMDVNGDEIKEVRRPGILSEASKLMVAKLVDQYLAEIAKDPHLPLSAFVDLAEMISSSSRPGHDGLYRAIDMYMKVHPSISKSERKRICRLMDCKKLSVEACMHAVQNERLPLRVVVQVLFFEQVRAAATSGSSTPDLPKALKDLSSTTSHGSSRSATTNTEEDWDAVASAEELRALKGELAAMRLGNGSMNERNGGGEKAAISRVKGLLKTKKIFSKIWSGKGGGVQQGENSGSDSSESLGSTNMEETKSTPSRKGRHSVS